MERLRRERADIAGVEILELFNVKDGGGLGDAADIEGVDQLGQGEELLLGALAARRPAQQRHVVEDGGG